MNIKRYLIASAVGLAFLFGMDFLIHGVLLKSMYESTQHLWRAKEDMICQSMIAGQILLVLTLGYIFSKGQERRGVPEGVRFGVVIGLLFAAHNLIMYAVAPYPMELTIAWILGGIVEMVGVGVIFASLYRA